MKKNNLGFKQIIIIFVIVILVILCLYVFINNKNSKGIKAHTPESQKFKVLQNYLVSSGYQCGNLNNAGSSCEKKTDVNKYTFFRYNDGLQYLIESVNYKINILYRKDSNEISIQTLDGAFSGYEKKKYFCSTDTGSILSTNINCKTDNKEELDNIVYITVVKNSLIEVRNILENSGFDINVLIKSFEWQNKK